MNVYEVTFGISYGSAQAIVAAPDVKAARLVAQGNKTYWFNNMKPSNVVRLRGVTSARKKPAILTWFDYVE